MDYEDRVKSLKEEGKGQRLSVRRIVLEPKQVLTGVFLGRELVQAKKKGFPDSYSYRWDTTEGTVTCFLSHNFDQNEGGRLAEGNLYELTYLGKRSISEGRTLKEFELVDYGPMSDEEEEDDDGEGEE